MFRWFERRLDPFPELPVAAPPATLVAFCRYYARGAWGWLLLAAMLMAVTALIEVKLFDFLGHIVDWLSAQPAEGFFARESQQLLVMAGVVLVLLPATVILHGLVQSQVLMGNLPMRIRWQAHRYLLSQSMHFYQDEFAGRLATKVLQTALAVRETLIKLIGLVNYVCVYFVGTVLIVAQADTRLALPLLAWLLGYLMFLRVFVPRMGRIAARQADARSVMTGRIVDSYTNIQTVKLFSHAQREADYARDGMGQFMDTVYPQMRLVTWLEGALYGLNALLLVGIGGLSLWLWQQGAVTVGAVAVAVGLVLRIWNMSQWVMWEVAALFENIGTVQDGMKTLTQPRRIEDQPGAPTLALTRGAIDFRQLRFRYDGAATPLFDGLDLQIAAGEKVGIVGRSGAGKSTLVSLLLRFHELERGQICLDGQDIATVTQDSLRAAIGMVTQDTSLLHRSVRENISYGHPQTDDQQVIDAAKRAHAWEFIPALCDNHGRQGLDAHVGERGVKLSGGQRQRVAIARVILKDAPILVLDEATSALDSEVEEAIQENLYALMEGKTVIAIAHRLSTIAAMDRLVVMDQGRIVEQGTHAELVARGGLYASLWQRQSGGFIGE